METQSLKFFIYKTTNLINQKIYIGKHKTKNLNDGYIGSGKLLKRAINKHGRENFKFEILEWFDDEFEMNERERELVTKEFCLREDTYNLCVGGQGGFSYINRLKINNSNKDKQAISKKLSKMKMGIPRPDISVRLREQHRKGLRSGVKAVIGSGNTPEANMKRSATMSALYSKKHPQTGMIWISNGTRSKKIFPVDPLPEGWYKGRNLVSRCSSDA